MDEQSIWKKEISFGRKPKEPKAAVESQSTSEGEGKGSSVWKKEISFGRKPKEPKEPKPASEGEKSSSLWKKEISFGRKPNEPKEAVESQSTPEGEGKGSSVWKKEISFGRKPKEPKEPKPASEGEKSSSLWKKEISFGRKPKEPKEAVADEPAADAHVDEPDSTPVEAEPAVESAPEEPVWQRAVSFTRNAEQAPVASETDPSGHDPGSDPETRPEESVAVEPAADADVDEPEPTPAEAEPAVESAPEEPVWQRAVSFTRNAEQTPAASDADPSGHDPGSDPETRPEESVAVEPAADAHVDEPEPTAAEAEPAVESAPEEPVWQRAVSSTRNAEQTPAASDTDPSGHDPGTVPESGPEEPVWTRAVSLTPTTDAPADEPAADTEPTPEPEPAATEEPAAGESLWKRELSHETNVEAEAEAPPAPPPVAPLPPAVEPPPVHVHSAYPEAPTPREAETDELPVVTPPVPAAELPPLATDVPFWKKELSFGKKRDKAPKAERAKEPKAGKEPKPKPKPKPKQQKASRIKLEKRAAKGEKRLVGLKVGASQLAAARVSNNGSAELLQVARQPLEPGIVVGGELRDPDALAAALKDFFATNKLPKRGVRLGISNNRIGVRTLEIAGIQDAKQLMNAIRFRAQEALPIPLDEAVLDYQVLSEGVDGEGQPIRRILLVVAYRELIDRYVDACRKAGITLMGIDLEAFALLRALQAPQDGVGNDPNAALVAVAIGHERSTFAVSNGRVCEFTRVLEWGGSALNVTLARVLERAPSEVEEVKRSLSLVDGPVPAGLDADQGRRAVEAVRKSVQTFARELVSSLQYYQNQPGSLGIGEIVLTGGTAHLPGLAVELERLIGVRVRVGDPLARMKIAKRVGEPDQIGSLAVAIGLGIED